MLRKCVRISPLISIGPPFPCSTTVFFYDLSISTFDPFLFFSQSTNRKRTCLRITDLDSPSAPRIALCYPLHLIWLPLLENLPQFGTSHRNPMASFFPPPCQLSPFTLFPSRKNSDVFSRFMTLYDDFSPFVFLLFILCASRISGSTYVPPS